MGRPDRYRAPSACAVEISHCNDRLWRKPSAGAGSARYLEDFVLSHSDPATGSAGWPRARNADAPACCRSTPPKTLLAAVLASVDDDKAEDVVQIDLRGRSDVADYMVICSGRSSRQVAAISEKLADRMKEAFRLTVQDGRQGNRRLGADRHGRCDRPCLPPRSARVLSA